MNLPNKITISRIILSIVVLILLIFPIEKIGLDLPTIIVSGKVQVNIKYFICGILFLIASITDSLDGHIARKYNMVTDFGKVMDAIADKLLVNGVLIILACTGFINMIIPVIIISRDIIVDSIKMVVGNKVGAVGASSAGKLKTVFMMCGVTLMLFYNLPFELWGLRIADFLIMTATILSVVSGVEYYLKNKRFLTE
jgi:CDP-diacylglycerol--glycerol-3-phosphate 3-phosphatidyltransferase